MHPLRSQTPCLVHGRIATADFCKSAAQGGDIAPVGGTFDGVSDLNGERGKCLAVGRVPPGVAFGFALAAGA